MILPQFDQAPLFNSINFGLAIEAPANQTARMTTVADFLCPSDPQPQPFWAAQRDLSTGALTANICQLAPADYVGVSGVSEPGPDGEGVLFRDSQVAFRDVTDGTSQTIFVGERSRLLNNATWVGSVTGAVLYPTGGNGVGRGVAELGPGLVLGHAGEHVGPGDPNSEVNQFYSLHPPRGANFAFGDGHIAFLKSTINYQTYLALSTRSGGEVVSADSY
jgi:prepilin-type processing-associated H-X9-DG protein